MDDKWLSAAIAMMTATVGLAIVAVLVSKNSQTSTVLQTLFTGYSSVLQTAISPITGNSSSSGN